MRLVRRLFGTPAAPLPPLAAQHLPEPPEHDARYHQTVTTLTAARIRLQMQERERERRQQQAQTQRMLDAEIDALNRTSRSEQ